MKDYRVSQRRTVNILMFKPQPFKPTTAGVSKQGLVLGGAQGPQSYFQLNRTSFWTRGTIDDQFIDKGVHH